MQYGRGSRGRPPPPGRHPRQACRPELSTVTISLEPKAEIRPSSHHVLGLWCTRLCQFCCYRTLQDILIIPIVVYRPVPAQSGSDRGCEGPGWGRHRGVHEAVGKGLASGGSPPTSSAVSRSTPTVERLLGCVPSDGQWYPPRRSGTARLPPGRLPNCTVSDSNDDTER